MKSILALPQHPYIPLSLLHRQEGAPVEKEKEKLVLWMAMGFWKERKSVTSTDGMGFRHGWI